MRLRQLCWCVIGRCRILAKKRYSVYGPNREPVVGWDRSVICRYEQAELRRLAGGGEGTKGLAFRGQKEGKAKQQLQISPPPGPGGKVERSPCKSELAEEMKSGGPLREGMLGRREEGVEFGHAGDATFKYEINFVELPRISNETRGRGGVVVRQPTSNQGASGSFPARSFPGFSHLRIVPDDTAGRRVFSGISRLPRPFIPPAAPHSSHFTLIGYQYLDVKGAATKNSTRVTKSEDQHMKWHFCVHVPFLQRHGQRSNQDAALAARSNLALLLPQTRDSRRCLRIRASETLGRGGTVFPRYSRPRTESVCRVYEHDNNTNRFRPLTAGESWYIGIVDYPAEKLVLSLEEMQPRIWDQWIKERLAERHAGILRPRRTDECEDRHLVRMAITDHATIPNTLTQEFRHLALLACASTNVCSIKASYEWYVIVFTEEYPSSACSITMSHPCLDGALCTILPAQHLEIWLETREIRKCNHLVSSYAMERHRIPDPLVPSLHRWYAGQQPTVSSHRCWSLMLPLIIRANLVPRTSGTMRDCMWHTLSYGSWMATMSHYFLGLRVHCISRQSTPATTTGEFWAHIATTWVEKHSRWTYEISSSQCCVVWQRLLTPVRYTDLQDVVTNGPGKFLRFQIRKLYVANVTALHSWVLLIFFFCNGKNKSARARVAKINIHKVWGPCWWTKSVVERFKEAKSAVPIKPREESIGRRALQVVLMGGGGWLKFRGVPPTPLPLFPQNHPNYSHPSTGRVSLTALSPEPFRPSSRRAIDSSEQRFKSRPDVTTLSSSVPASARRVLYFAVVPLPPSDWLPGKRQINKLLREIPGAIVGGQKGLWSQSCRNDINNLIKATSHVTGPQKELPHPHIPTPFPLNHPPTTGKMWEIFPAQNNREILLRWLAKLAASPWVVWAHEAVRPELVKQVHAGWKQLRCRHFDVNASLRGDRGMRINSLIASTRKALNWRAVLPSMPRLYTLIHGIMSTFESPAEDLLECTLGILPPYGGASRQCNLVTNDTSEIDAISFYRVTRRRRDRGLELPLCVRSVHTAARDDW
ncbi:hypothetical protein PR048_025464 [Dryococelus australis]|uniref:Uncharacterized protein n=1 Tax=Dryococelus australis TaxID=614101 RepID=A0ABQ9GRF9_9NEOP|nr:hypothetical protein PR048_025464 [Dryococelus australis]